MGGKWTSFRSQGEETVDLILKDNPDLFKDTLKYETGQTLNFNLIGSYSKNEIITGLKLQPEKLFEQYEDYFVFERKIPRDIAKHLVKTYGTTSLRIVEAGDKDGRNTKRLHDDFPFVESEVLFGIKNEMVVKPNDIVCRRVPISFIDSEVAKEKVLPSIVDMMGKELGWNQERKTKELNEAIEGLATMK